MREIILCLLLMGCIFPSKIARATVFEFESDGSFIAYEAQDYLATIRHKKPSSEKFKPLVQSNQSRKFDEFVLKAARKYEVDANLIHAVISTESSYDPNALSIKGAGGLMQLLPGTARQYGVEDRFSPEDNINGGTKYLKFLLNRYGGDIDLAVAAYNAGEGTVDRYGDIPPYAETRAYVQKIVLYLENSH